MGRRPWMGAPLISVMLHHSQELGLSPDQVRELERLRGDFTREAIRRRADIEIAELDLATLRRADVADLAQVEAKLREIERLRADVRLARIRTIEQGKGHLTPEQRTKLRALLAERPHGRPPAFRPTGGPSLIPWTPASGATAGG